MVRADRVAGFAGGFGWIGDAQALDIRELKRDGLCKALVLSGDIAFNEAAEFIPRMTAAADRCGSRTIVFHRMPGGSAFTTAAQEERTYGEIKSALIGYVATMGGNPDYVELMYAVGKDGPGPSQRTLDRADMMRLGLATQDGAPF